MSKSEMIAYIAGSRPLHMRACTHFILFQA